MMMMGRKLRRGLAMALAVAGVTGFPASVTFTRSRGNATYLNSAGVLTEETADNVERVAYTAAGAPAGIPIEGEARTSKCTVVNYNPTATTGLSKGGDAAATLAVVSDTAALAAAGLGTICSNGNVYKLDNSAGATNAFVSIAGTTGNTNTHIGDAYVRGSGTGWIGQNGSATGRTALTYASGYERKATSAFTPVDTSRTLEIAAAAGAVVYFILFNLQEGATDTATILHNTAATSTRNAETAYMQALDGAELVQNGSNATTTTHWPVGASGGTLDTNAGRLRLTGTTGQYFYQAIPVVVGRSYTLTAAFTKTTANSAAFVGNAAGGTTYGTSTLTASGTYTLTFVPTQPLIYIGFNCAAPGVVEWGNISLRNAVPYAGFNNGPDGTRDCWDATRVGVPSGYDTTVTAGDRAITATKGATNARAYLNLYTRPGATYRVRFTLSSGSATIYANNSSNGSGAVITSMATTAAQTAFTFVATTGITSLMWDSGASFAVANIYVEEVSATAPIGAAPHNLFANPKFADSSAWTLNSAASISGGQLNVGALGSASIDIATQPFTLTAGKVYRITYNLVSITGSLSSKLDAVRVGTIRTTAGIYSDEIACTATGSYNVGFISRGSGLTSAVIKDVEVREVGHVQNGDFANGTTGWTAGGAATLSVTSGVLRVTNDATGASFGYAYQAFTTVVGKTYMVRAQRIASSSANTNNVHIGTAGGGSSIAANKDANTPFTFTATATTTYITLLSNSNVANGWVEYDNIVVEEVTEQGQGALVVEFSLPALNTSRFSYIAAFSDGTTSNMLYLAVNSAGVPIVEVIVGGVTQVSMSLNGGSAITAGQVVRAALTWTYNRVTGSVNGTSVSTDTACLIPQASRLDLLNRPAGDRAANGYLRYLGPLRSSQNDNWPPLVSVVAA